jgi:uncharacterized membrane protein
MIKSGTSAATRPSWQFDLRNPTMEGPWRWLAFGWRDLWRAPAYSLGYGFVFVAAGLAGTVGLWWLGLESIVPAIAAGFGLLGPVLAVGLYEISRRHAAGEALDAGGIAFVRTASVVQLGLLAFFLMFVFLVWMRAATLIYALFTHGNYLPLDRFVTFALTTPEGLSMLAIGTLVGAVLALVVFAISVISVPMLVHRDVDAITAIAASVRAVVSFPGPMLLWAWLVALFMAFGIATLFVGLIVVFPLLGHATWHAYNAIVVER